MMRTFDAGEEEFFKKEIVACPWVDKTVLEHGEQHVEEEAH